MSEKNQDNWQFIALFYVIIINIMYWMKNQSRQENVIYLAVWGILFLAPLLSYYVRTANDATISFDWTEIMMVWQHFGLYLLLFMIHNFLLAPLLIHQHKRLLYFGALAVIIVGFATYQYSHHPRFQDRRHPMEMRGDHSFMEEGHRPPQFCSRRICFGFRRMIIKEGMTIAISTTPVPSRKISTIRSGETLTWYSESS